MKSLRKIATLIVLIFVSGNTIIANELTKSIYFKFKKGYPLHKFSTNEKPKDQNTYSVIENINNYPELALALQGYDFKIERPGYYSSKKELTSVFRITLKNPEKLNEVIAILKKQPTILYAELAPTYKMDL
ncbi:MAG: hypothetical protein H6587_02615 [Flavobacteriales bacterium]|nr:hypothetical protein [Flavobacteriales bacterium]MCB9363439.1 hypothetical protein [Flavobacteriales bacterium]